MPKFSIIIPVYNVEKYIKKCIESVFNQTDDSYEVIVVNDGSNDNSIDLIKDYNVKLINQTNKGLSAARNIGAKEANGEYLIFLDSDDYIDKDLIKYLKENTKNNPDLIRYQIRTVFENYENSTTEYNEKSFENKSGVDAFELIVKYHFIENACCYAIKNEYYKKNNFQFREGTYHEDFGLIPLIILKAKVVNSISYIGYNYLQRQGSIMHSDDYNKISKKVDDFYTHYKYLMEEASKLGIDTSYFKSFISNSFILKITELNKSDYKKYRKILKQERVYDYLITDSFSRKIKKILVQLLPKLFFKFKR